MGRNSISMALVAVLAVVILVSLQNALKIELIWAHIFPF
jgi:hypothetical protein